MKKTVSPLMRKFNALRRAKTKSCQGNATAADLNKAKSAYVDAAVKKGQSKTEATAKANRILMGSCSAVGKRPRAKKRK